MLADAQAMAVLATSDMDRAKSFYSDTLGFSIERESPGGVMYRAGKGTTFFVYPSEFAGTNKATAMGLTVDDFDATIADLRGKGITFLEFEYEGMKTENGVMRMPDGLTAWFSDPDGNIIAVESGTS
jgi:catechol 2,3-dioxygenase-like lactoylglutathione lyase family enzyme